VNQITSIKNASPSDRLAFALATGAGAGFSPIAPGTVGAIEAVGIFFITTLLKLEKNERLLLLIALNVVVFVVGVWASSRTCELLKAKDPGRIVIDEISGQLIALAPLAFAPSVSGVVAAFLLFRLFDIFKPYPIHKLEHLPGGLGVMMDDVLAGIYAAALVAAGMYLKWLQVY
jgi:phosphatidylglycerophosphatase A